jgi:hypothetical protein
MLSKPNISGKNKPDIFCSANDDIVSNGVENSTSIPTNKIKESWDKFREHSITRWHPSKLEGYVSDEFRSVEFAD